MTQTGSRGNAKYRGIFFPFQLKPNRLTLSFVIMYRRKGQRKSLARDEHSKTSTSAVVGISEQNYITDKIRRVIGYDYSMFIFYRP